MIVFRDVNNSCWKVLNMLKKIKKEYNICFLLDWNIILVKWFFKLFIVCVSLIRLNSDEVDMYCLCMIWSFVNEFVYVYMMI